MRQLLTAAMMLLLTASTAYASVGDFRHASRLGLRTNRLALGLFSDSGYRVPLSNDPGILWKNTHIETGAVTLLSPAIFNAGGYFQIAPIAPLEFRVQLQRMHFFGTFGHLTQFENKDSDWSPSVLDANEEAGGEFTTGWQAQGRAKLKLKFGNVIALHEQRITFIKADIDEGSAFYEPALDLLLERQDSVHTMKGTLGYIVSGSTDGEFIIVAGQWESYEAQESGAKRQVAGGVVLMRPWADAWGKPVFGLLATDLFEDKYKEGEFMASFFAQIVLDAKD